MTSKRFWTQWSQPTSQKLTKTWLDIKWRRTLLMRLCSKKKTSWPPTPTFWAIALSPFLSHNSENPPKTKHLRVLPIFQITNNPKRPKTWHPNNCNSNNKTNKNSTRLLQFLNKSISQTPNFGLPIWTTTLTSWCRMFCDKKI